MCLHIPGSCPYMCLYIHPPTHPQASQSIHSSSNLTYSCVSDITLQSFLCTPQMLHARTHLVPTQHSTKHQTMSMGLTCILCSHASCACLKRQFQISLPARKHKAASKSSLLCLQPAVELPDTLTSDYPLFMQNFERQTKQGES